MNHIEPQSIPDIFGIHIEFHIFQGVDSTFSPLLGDLWALLLPWDEKGWASTRVYQAQLTKQSTQKYIYDYHVILCI